MKFSKYITHTWLLANLIHPVIYWIYFLVPVRSEIVIESLGDWFLCVIFSLPGYFMGCILFSNVRNSVLPKLAKLFALIVIAIAGIIMSIWFLSFVVSANDRFNFLLKQSIPAIIAATLSILVRYRQFIQSINSETYENYFFP